MMNILEQEDIIKGLPDQVLMQEAQKPSGELPQFLVVSEIQRRSDMRKRYKADQGQMPQATVKEQVVQEGIMSAMSPQMAMAPQMPQRMPQMPPPQMMSEGGEATLLDRYYNLDTDDPRGEGFELDADDDPTVNRQGILQGLALLGVDQETIDNATRRMTEPPKGLVDIIENVILRHRKIRDRRTERKANGGAVYKPLDPRTQNQLDVMIDSDQMGYADILSFINQIPGTPEDRASMMEYVRNKTGVLERAGYQIGQAVDYLGDRLGSAYDRVTGAIPSQAERMEMMGFNVNPEMVGPDGQIMKYGGGTEGTKPPSLFTAPTSVDDYSSPTDFLADEAGIPMILGGPGRGLVKAGGRELMKRVGLPAIRSADDLLEFIPMGVPAKELFGSAATTQLGAPADAEDFDSRVKVADSILDYQPNFEEIGKKRKEQAGIEEPLGIDPKPPMADSILADSVPKGGIEEKGGGDEVQATSADRMAELLDRMGRTNRGAALVALGTGIAEGKTMQGGKEAANILAKGQQAQTKLEIDATQFDQQMDLLEQRVKNAARSGNASVIAALVSATSRELEALTDIVGLSDPATVKRIQSLRNTLSQLSRTYMPTSGGADGIYPFGSLTTGSPSRAKP